MPQIQSAAFILAILLTAVLACKKLPIDIQRCRINDCVCIATSISYILKTFHQGIGMKGIANLGFPVFEPLFIKKMELKAKTIGLIRLDQTFYDVSLHGLSLIKIKSVTSLITNTECKLNIKLSASYLKFAGKYKGVGTVFGLSMNGEGPFDITLRKSDMDLDFECVKTVDGFLKIVRVDLDLTAPSIELEFPNLVKTSKYLGDIVLGVLKDRSQFVFDVLKDDYEPPLAAVFKQLSSNIFDNVSIAELFVL